MYLRLIKLGKSFGKIRAVENFCLDVEQGEFLCILGPSGCGKTTTLKMVGGFIAPGSGRIILDGTDITDLPPEKRPTATVFQNYALFPHMSVLENVVYGLRLQKMPSREIGKRGREMLELVGLDVSGQKSVQELSGGEQQRVALARALIIGPKILLMDEPLSNLDAGMRLRMREEIRLLQKRLQITMLYVTHDQEEALGMAERIVVMNRGRIEQVGSPQELYEKPANIFVAGFLGRMNFLVNGREVSAIRPEHILVSSMGEHQVELKDKSFLGPYTLLNVDFAGRNITIHLPSQDAAQIRVGDSLRISLPPDLLMHYSLN